MHDPDFPFTVLRRIHLGRRATNPTERERALDDALYFMHLYFTIFVVLRSHTLPRLIGEIVERGREGAERMVQEHPEVLDEMDEETRGMLVDILFLPGSNSENP